eukprot:Ihof_evm10s73 gene=Ihof_evmTU10s73
MATDPHSDVQEVTCYRMNGLTARLYVWPFAVCYLAWFAAFVTNSFQLSMPFVTALGLLVFGHLVTYLATFWSVTAHALLTATKVSDVRQATHVKVVPRETVGDCELAALHVDKLVDLATKEQEDVLWFAYHKAKYVYHHGDKEFLPIAFPTDQPLGSYLQAQGVGGEGSVINGLQRYGPNIFEIPIPSFGALFKEHIVAPFFVFQVLCVLLWSLDDYVLYSLMTLAMLSLFECTVVYSRVRNLRDLHGMLGDPQPIMVYRTKTWMLVSSATLLPGDLVAVEHSTAVPCDLLLLSGTCVVNEAMLTGESTPTLKEPPTDVDPAQRLDMTVHRRHVLYGGTSIVHSTPGNEKMDVPCPPRSSNIAYVLQTGFHTQQGRLLRTIVFGGRRVTANNTESLAIILFLLAWALLAASYVWMKGVEKGRDTWKLGLECLLIITSVVPPELPMELSLAVNNSLIALQRLAIFCTEPFRIPFAGKVDVVCFDKTGTLTGDQLHVAGVVMLGKHGQALLSMEETNPATRCVIGGCQSLALATRPNTWAQSMVVGDPLEQALLKAAGWTLCGDNQIRSATGDGPCITILRRFHFTSSLKRMSTIVGVKDETGSEFVCALTKGAPEILEGLYGTLPSNYKETVSRYAREGYRVLALGYRRLNASAEVIRKMDRDETEAKLEFGGLILVECPLRRESRAAVTSLMRSSHRVLMITGDNPLTGCHVATATGMIKERHKVFVLAPPEDGGEGELGVDWHWASVQGDMKVPLTPAKETKLMLKQHQARLCVTGEGLLHLQKANLYHDFVNLIVVYARMTPELKEAVVVALRQRGHVVAMCGDGTNDVGALKQAHVGVALLNGPWGNSYHDFDRYGGRKRTVPQRKKHQNKRRTEQAQDGLAQDGFAQEGPQIAQLGDASIASPFTAKVSSVMAVVHIIRQGRCTLVTTLQMYRILALNCLINAFCLSVLSIDVIKFSDLQYTIEGLLLAACFLFVSRSKPLPALSVERPQPDIFNYYLLATIMGQFVVHVTILIMAVQAVKKHLGDSFVIPDSEATFEASLLNTVVYLFGLHMITVNFLVNSKGRPFMEGLRDNRLLAGTLVCMFGLVACLTLGLSDDLAYAMDVVDIPAG